MMLKSEKLMSNIACLGDWLHSMYSFQQFCFFSTRPLWLENVLCCISKVADQSLRDQWKSQHLKLSFFLFKFFNRICRSIAKKKKIWQSSGFLWGITMRVPWLAKQFSNITVGFLSPAFSDFQNKDDLLYAHSCLT